MHALGGTPFDPAETEKLLETFMRATAIPCAIIDDNGKLLAEHRGPSEQHGCSEPFGQVFCCPICSLAANPERATACTTVHRYAGFQSLRFGGRYTYFCPSSLTYFSAPLFRDGDHIATFVAGPVLLISPESYIREELERLPESAPSTAAAPEPVAADSHARALTVVRSLPFVDPQRAHAVGEMLLYLASWASDANVRETATAQDTQSREADISTYIHLLKSMGGDQAEDAPAFDQALEERRLLDHIREGDREAARDQIARLLAHLRITTGSEIAAVKSRVLELAVLLSRAAIDGGADPESVFGLNYRALEEVQRISRVPELSAWLSRISERFLAFVIDVRQYRQRDVIRRAQAYIRSHLGDRVGLEVVAQHVRLSPAYLSHLFHEQTGERFTEYLARCRVDQSKELLRSGDHPLKEIALEVGFSDQSHFSRVFKKRVGVSPSRFRDRPWTVSGDTREIHEQ